MPQTPDPSLCRESEPRCIDNDTHQAAGHDTCDGQRDEPAQVDPGDHAPVDGAPSARAETDANRGTGDALRRGDGQGCREA